jgi:hypothetical protein
VPAIKHSWISPVTCKCIPSPTSAGSHLHLTRPIQAGRQEAAGRIAAAGNGQQVHCRRQRTKRRRQPYKSSQSKQTAADMADALMQLRLSMYEIWVFLVQGRTTGSPLHSLVCADAARTAVSCNIVPGQMNQQLSKMAPQNKHAHARENAVACCTCPRNSPACFPYFTSSCITPYARNLAVRMSPKPCYTLLAAHLHPQGQQSALEGCCCQALLDLLQPPAPGRCASCQQ